VKALAVTLSRRSVEIRAVDDLEAYLIGLLLRGGICVRGMNRYASRPRSPGLPREEDEMA
jgi:hypothetical protein